jgi:hypothetical protein
MSADGPVGERSAEDLARAVLGQRLRLPEYFVDPVLVEGAVREGDLYFVTVRIQGGAFEQIPLDGPGPGRCSAR